MIVGFLVIGIFIENVILVRQNRKLKSPLVAQVHEGQRFVNLAGVALDGKVKAIGLPTAITPELVIFTFSPGCPFCQKTQPIWAELAKDLRQRGINVLWVSRDAVEPTRDYCKYLEIPLANVIAAPPSSTFNQLGLQAVPDTIVVGSGGVVKRVWSGSLDRDASRAVFSYFGISQVSVPWTGVGTGSREATSAKCCEVPAQKN